MTAVCVLNSGATYNSRVWLSVRHASSCHAGQHSLRMQSSKPANPTVQSCLYTQLSRAPTTIRLYSRISCCRQVTTTATGTNTNAATTSILATVNCCHSTPAATQSDCPLGSGNCGWLTPRMVHEMHAKCVCILSYGPSSTHKHTKNRNRHNHHSTLCTASWSILRLAHTPSRGLEIEIVQLPLQLYVSEHTVQRQAACLSQLQGSTWHSQTSTTPSVNLVNCNAAFTADLHDATPYVAWTRSYADCAVSSVMPVTPCRTNMRS